MVSFSACGQYVSLLPDSPAEETVDEHPGEEAADGTFNETPLMTFLGWYDLSENYYSDTPAAVSLCCVTDGARGCDSPRMDRVSIIAACDALRAMTVTGAAEAPADGQAELIYTLTMDDGTAYSVTFSDGYLVTDGGCYTVTGGDDLWTLTFPVYSSDFDVFDLYFDDSVRAFADNFYTDMPVSVGLRSGGGATMTSEDTAVITQVFSLLAGASVTVVEERPDQNIDLTQTRDFIFTMADGTIYTFSFAGQCLAVTANDDYGTVYYWLSGHEGLWAVSLSPEGAVTVFEGGSLYELRSDIDTVRQILDGENTELTIDGVYVSYTQDGASGSFALSGDDAVNFLQSVVSVSVSAETASETEGNTAEITVSLSDGSGPTISFTGASVQQLVGVNYICDSDDIQAIWASIDAYAADGSHNVETGLEAMD